MAHQDALWTISKPFRRRVGIQVDLHATLGHAISQDLDSLEAQADVGRFKLELQQGTIRHAGHAIGKARGGRVTIFINPADLVQQGGGSSHIKRPGSHIGVVEGVFGGQVGVQHNGFAKQDGIHHSLAVHAHGHSPPQADIGKGAKTVVIFIPAGKARALKGQDVEGNVFPRIVGDKDRIEQSGSIELEQQIRLIIQGGGLINNIAVASQDGSDVGIGCGAQEAEGHRFEIGQAFSSAEVVGVLDGGNVIAAHPLGDDVRAPACVEHLAINLGDQFSHGVMTPDMPRAGGEIVDEIGRVQVARQASPDRGYIISGQVRLRALNQVFRKRAIGAALKLEAVNRVGGGEGSSIRPEQAREHLESGRKLIHLNGALGVYDGTVRGDTAGRANLLSGGQNNRVAIIVDHGSAGSHIHNLDFSVAISEAGQLLKDNRLVIK